MAEGTRVRELQEAHKLLEKAISVESDRRTAVEQSLQDQILQIGQGMEQQIRREMDKQSTHITGKFDALSANLSNTLASMQLQLSNLGKFREHEDMGSGSILGDPSTREQYDAQYQRTPYSGRSRVVYDGSRENHHTPYPRVDFPKFDGSFPRAWVLKCNGYFSMINNLSDSQKITLATMNFEDKAAQWYQNSTLVSSDLHWEQFVDIVSARFEDLKDSKIIAEFNKLKHTGTYTDYVEKFEELKGCLNMLNGVKFSEEYFISSFISGLGEEIQSAIHMFKPTTLSHAIELGQQQLINMEAMTKKFRGAQKPLPNFPRRTDATPNTTKAPPSNQNPGFKLLTPAEMAARREKQLCYNCDEKWSTGHRCKQRLAYALMSVDEEVEHLMSLSDDQNQTPADTGAPVEELEVALNTISGDGGLTTFSLVGSVGTTKLSILIDTGSSLSFIKETTAKALGCSLEKTRPLLVKVASGDRLVSSNIVPNFTWDMQGTQFTHGIRTLAHDGCDLIIGGDWLKRCSPVSLHYDDMSFVVNWKGKKIRLQALTRETNCHLITGPALFQMLHHTIPSPVEEVFWVKLKL